jgi:hypothetical protein
MPVVMEEVRKATVEQLEIVVVVLQTMTPWLQGVTMMFEGVSTMDVAQVTKGHTGLCPWMAEASI